MQRLLGGAWITQVVRTFALLNVGDVLHFTDGKTVEEVAGATGLSCERARVFLNAAGWLGLVNCSDEHFTLTTFGGFLRREHPQSLYAIAVFQGGPAYEAWGTLPELLRGTTTGFERTQGRSIYADAGLNDPLGKLTDAAIASLSHGVTNALADHVLRHGVVNVLDLGGGDGRLAATLATQRPGMLVAVLERSAAAGPCQAAVDANVTWLTGDFRRSVPTGYDGYLLVRVVHNLADADLLDLYQRIRATMSHSSHLFVAGPTAGATGMGALLDLNALVLTGGRVRTESALRSIAARAGLVSTASYSISDDCHLEVFRTE
ncbi:MAG: methyltransferase [Pseudomarimonas sp.]